MIRRMLDLYCGGGGAAMGYYRAFGHGTEIVGVDYKPQPNYPFDFILGNALAFMWDGRGDGFDFYHASPPCKRFTAMQNIRDNRDAHPDLIGITRRFLKRTGKPYVIENVRGAPLNAVVMLCGTMFGLPIIRHRYFEIWPEFPLVLLPPCDHRDVFDPWHGTVETGRSADKFREAMGIDWLPQVGGPDKKGCIDDAIPPAYTEWIGRRIVEADNGTHDD